MDQNTIAIIWDFDKTLTPNYMQNPIFEQFKVDPVKFWVEVNSLPEKYALADIKVNKDTIYLNHMITCVRQGLFPRLNNKLLKELGQKIEFYNGIPEIFSQLDTIIDKPQFKTFNIHIENYIVSTGITQMIRGSKVAPFIKDIWGCEFIENPIPTKLCKENSSSRDDILSQIGYIIDNTSKTRAIFEINKGANVFPKDIDVNSTMKAESRRVPFENMVYIADGPSDIPVFSILKQYGGSTFAIYPKGNKEAFDQVELLLRGGRIDSYAEADYSSGTQTNMWLTRRVEEIANKIYQKMKDALDKSAGKPPRHIVEE
ncbi:hypothetical protein FACS1894211_08770 [Clostridia bacterium]|nr:hypothetical protein FACS1894211_08770 [Clostridia bacterium]